MKKYLILFIAIVVTLFLLVYIKKNITEESIVEKSILDNKPELKREIVKEHNTFGLPERVAITDEIEEFNTKVFNAIRFGPKSKAQEINNLFQPPQKDDSKFFEDKIKSYFENYEENFHQAENLAFYCIKLEDGISNIEERLEDNSQIFEAELNGYFFDKALMDSEYCKKYGTREDPFWMMLKLARQGNEEMRVFLLEYMNLAIHRGAINIKKYPDKYLELRSEAEGYLRKYSHKGVIYATEFLYSQYSGKLGKNQLLPTNPVLTYYYAYLADVQNTVAYGYWEKDLLKMYDRLTEQQKSIVDRMTENL